MLGASGAVVDKDVSGIALEPSEEGRASRASVNRESARGSLKTGEKLEEGKAVASGDSTSEALKECRDLEAFTEKEASGTFVGSDEALEGEASKLSPDGD